MDALVKGLLQGSIPTIVLVGGTHYLVKGFKVSRPVVYWGSLAVAAGLTYAVVEGKIKVPFMNAETFGADVCPSCEADTSADYCWVCAKCLDCCYCDPCSNCLADGSSECVCGEVEHGFLAETFGAESDKVYVLSSYLFNEAIVANNEQTIKNLLKPYYLDYLVYDEDYESEEKSLEAWDKMSLEEAVNICEFNLDVMDLSKGIRIFRDGEGLRAVRQ